MITFYTGSDIYLNLEQPISRYKLIYIEGLLLDNGIRSRFYLTDDYKLGIQLESILDREKITDISNMLKEKLNEQIEARICEDGSDTWKYLV